MSENPTTNKYKLESVFVLHRHSIRSPTCYAPNFDEIHPSLFPRGTGYLTRRGIDVCKNVAEIWHSWYPEHINGKDHRSIFVRSSESPRCHETASALLQAIMSCGTRELNPVPIYSPPPGYDKYVSCAGYNKDISSQMRKFFKEALSESNTANAETMDDMYRFVKESFGDPNASEYDAFVYVDGITSNIYEHLSLPKFFVENESALREFYHFAYRTVIREFAPFYGFHLLRGMADRMKQVLNGELLFGNKWCDFSFHDFSISAVLTALDGKVRQPKPNFLGAIFFELLVSPDNGSKVVDVYYCSGLQPEGAYAEREPIRMLWNENSHRVPFEKLYDKMYNNIFLELMTSSESGRYTGDDAMV